MIKFIKPFIWICAIHLFLPGVAHAAILEESSGSTVFQVRIITGKVVGENNQPISNVTVMEAEMTHTTQTDTNGDFSLQLSAQAKAIRIHAVGYEEQVIDLTSKTYYSIKLVEKSSVLDEVVVVGFGTQKKVNLTGAVSVIDSKPLENVPVQNAVQALQGVIPGLNISYDAGGALNYGANLNIRGIGTIGEGSRQSVLVLVDGIEADLYSINPQDIETISVLKDAAASSIYGSRAPFGVILVTTKGGKKGKVTTNYNNSFRLSQPINIPRMADSYKFAVTMNQASVNAGKSEIYSQDVLQKIQDYMAGKLKYSTIPDPTNPSQWASGYSRQAYDNIDYYDVIYKENAEAQEHNISVSGANDKVDYYLSGNILGQNGTLKGNLDRFNRYTLSAKVNGQLSSKLNIGYNGRFIRTDYKAPSSLSEYTFKTLGKTAWPVKPLYDPNGNLFDDNVMKLNYGGRFNNDKTTLIQQINLQYEPVTNLKLVGEFHYKYNTNWDHTESLTFFQKGVDGYSQKATWNANSAVYEHNNMSDFYTTNLYGSYENTMGDHNLKGMVGFQAEEYSYRNLGASNSGIMIPTQVWINTATGLDSQNEQVPSTVSGGYVSWSTAGFFGRMNYRFKEKYLFEANMRFDSSSRYRKNKQWGVFPSFSIGWNITNERFFKTIAPMVDLFKIRGSYGSLGNQYTQYDYQTYYLMGYEVASKDKGSQWLLNGEKQNKSWAPNLISTALTWETINTTNIGLDWGVLNSKLTGSFDYFIRETRDMVGPAIELPATLGLAVPKTNNTDMETRGFEFEMIWKDKPSNDFSYSARFLLSDSYSKVTNYNNTSGEFNGYYSGKVLGEIWGYETVGLARTQEEMDNHLSTLTNGGQNALGTNWAAGDIMYKDLDGNGKIDWGASTLENPGDRKIIGNETPRYNMGLDLTANWKGLDFRIFFQGTLKRDVFINSAYFWGIYGSGADHWDSFLLREHVDYFRDDINDPLGVNLEAYYPRAMFNTGKNQQVQTRYLQNASYIRLKNFQIGYSIPSELTRRARIERLRVFVSGQNLFTFTKMTSLFDPESATGIYDDDKRISTGSSYPLSRVFSLGVSLNL